MASLKADKICEIADQIRSDLAELAKYAKSNRMYLAGESFDKIMKSNAELKSVAHREEE